MSTREDEVLEATTDPNRMDRLRRRLEAATSPEEGSGSERMDRLRQRLAAATPPRVTPSGDTPREAPAARAPTATPLSPERARLLEEAVSSSFTPRRRAPEPPARPEVPVERPEVPAEPGPRPTMDRPELPEPAAPAAPRPSAASTTRPVRRRTPGRQTTLEALDSLRNQLRAARDSHSYEFSPEFEARTEQLLERADSAAAELRAQESSGEEIGPRASALLADSVERSFQEDPAPEALNLVQRLHQAVTSIPGFEPTIRGEAPDPEDPRELGPTLGRFFSEERGRLGLVQEGVRGLARVPGEMVEGAGGIIQTAATRLPGVQEEDVFEGTVFEDEEREARRQERARGARERIMQLGRAVEETGRTSREAFPRSADVDPLDLTDPNALVAGSSQAIGQLGTQILMAMGTGGAGPITQFLTFAAPTVALEGGMAFTEGKERLMAQGMSEEEAENRAAGVAVTTALGAAALERIPASRFVFNRIPGADRLFNQKLAAALGGRGGFATAVLSGAGTEATEEVLQEVWSSTVQDLQAQNPEAWEDIGRRLAASATFGAAGGAFGGAVTRAAEGPEAAPGEPGEAPPAPGEGPPADVPAGEPEAAEADSGAQEGSFQRLRRRLADAIDPQRAQELEQAYTDQLTGAKNRDAFQRARPRLDADPEKEAVILDVINLHGMNSILGGQDQADPMLVDMFTQARDLAEQAGVDPRDIFRSGGDEFTLYVPKGMGKAVARSIKRQVGTPQIGDSDFVTGFRTGVGPTFAEADAAIFEAKQGETLKRFRAAEGGLTDEARAAMGEEPAAVEDQEAPEAPARRQPAAPTSPDLSRTREDVLGSAGALAATMEELESGMSITTGQPLTERQRRELASSAAEQRRLIRRRLNEIEEEFGEVPAGEIEAELNRALDFPDDVMQEVLDAAREQPVQEGAGSEAVLVERGEATPAPQIEEARRRRAQTEAQELEAVGRGPRALLPPPAEAGQEEGGARKARLVPQRREDGSVEWVAIPEEEPRRTGSPPPTAPPAVEGVRYGLPEFVTGGRPRRGRQEEAGPVVSPEEIETVLEDETFQEMMEEVYEDLGGTIDADSNALESMAREYARRQGPGTPIDQALVLAAANEWVRRQGPGATRETQQMEQLRMDIGFSREDERQYHLQAYLATVDGEPNTENIELRAFRSSVPFVGDVRLFENTAWEEGSDQGQFSIVVTKPGRPIEDSFLLASIDQVGGLKIPRWNIHHRDGAPMALESWLELAREPTLDDDSRYARERLRMVAEAIGSSEEMLAALPRDQVNVIKKAPKTRPTSDPELWALLTDDSLSIEELIARVKETTDRRSWEPHERAEQFVQPEVQEGSDWAGRLTLLRYHLGKELQEQEQSEEAEDEVTMAMGGRNIDPAEAPSEIQAAEGDTDEAQLEGAPQEEPASEPAGEVPNAVTVASSEPAPPGGAPGGRRDARDPERPAPETESRVDRGADREGGDGSGAPGARSGEGRGDDEGGDRGGLHRLGPGWTPSETRQKTGQDTARELARPGNMGLEVLGKNTRTADSVLFGASDFDAVFEQRREIRYPAPNGQISKIQANLEALRILKEVETEGRPATEEEQKAMLKYSGWGHSPGIFDQGHKLHNRFNEELRSLLTEEEWTAARRSTPNAHYTSLEVIVGIHEGLRHLGLPEDALVLEPSMGIGHFILGGPSSYRWMGVELDDVSGRIASLLYPRHKVYPGAGFQDVTLPENHFDAVVSNVPFGDYPVTDTRFPDTVTRAIHNYFFAKAVEVTRPGGLVAFITSNFTMDAKSKEVREYLRERADLVGAIRLPNSAFKANAGTEVTTDIIVLRKRLPDQNPAEAYEGTTREWTGTAELENGIRVNEYFARNPDMMLGTMELAGTMYGPDQPALVGEVEDIGGEIAERMKRLPGDLVAAREGPAAAAIDVAVLPDQQPKEGSMVVDDGEIKQYRRGKLVDAKVPKTRVKKVTNLIEIRDAARAVLEAQVAQAKDSEVKALQKNLHRAYDRFVKRYGPINKETITKAGHVLRPNYTPFRSDPDAPLVAALEQYDPEENTAKKAPIFDEWVVRPDIEIESVDEPGDALPVVLAELGKVDVPYMARLAHVSEADIIEALKGRIFYDPALNEWVTEDEYLSGNVKVKLDQARAAARARNKGITQLGPPDGYEGNVEALEAVQPEDLPPSQISVSIGTPWIPKRVYEEFLEEILDVSGVQLGHSAREALWVIERGGGYSPKATSEWGTDRVDAYKLYEKALNQQMPEVWDYESDGSRTKNVTATLAAREKLEKMKERFRTYLWQREDADALAQSYNDRFNNTRVRQFDGSHLQPAGMSPNIKLHGHQKDAAWRIISSGNTLLAHIVGAGKTFTMMTAAMEQRRMGLVKKPMFVVPNHMLDQFSREFLQLYPSARILAADRRDFAKNKRRALMAKIATGDWDAVIVTHSSFKRLDVSRATRERHLKEELAELARVIEEANATGSKTISKRLVKAQERLQDRLSKLMKAEEKDEGVTFEELGVDQLYVDEAHLFKNLYAPTKMDINLSTSQRATDLLLKMRYLEEVNPGRGAIFATSTPVSNSMAEVYTMMRYLQPDLLEERGIQHFDAWAAAFGEMVTAAEIKPDGSGFRMNTRFSRFKNLPELSQMFRQVWDVKRPKDINLVVPKLRGGTAQTVAVPRSPELADYVESLVKRSSRLSQVDPTEDNMLKITTDGRKAALDMRLIDPELDRDPEGKVAVAGQRIFDIYEDTAERKGTQLVFIDFSTPGEGFNVYDDLHEVLTEEWGIPAEEIAFIHDHDSDQAKARLFKKVRSGKVRILMGSTAKMGVGTNVQSRVVALHHLDAPWRPADIEQRDGRGVRQGNMNDEIQVIRYVTEGSFDAYMWQGLERKAFFIEQIITGDTSLRVAEDVSGGSLNASEVKALASGNPLAIEKASVDSDVARLQRLKAAHDDEQFAMRRKVSTLPGQIEAAEEHLEDVRRDAQNRIPTSGDAFRMQLGSTEYTDRAEAGELLSERLEAIPEESEEKLGRIAGLELWGVRQTIFARDGWYFELRGNGTYRSKNVKEFGVQGRLRSLESLAEGIDREIAPTEEKIQRLTKDLEQARATLGEAFAREDELAKLLRRQDEINKELKIGESEEQVSRHDEGIGKDPHGPDEEGLTDDEVDERGDAGFLVWPVKGRTRKEEEFVSSTFPEVEERIQAAKGIRPPSFTQKAKAAARDFKNAMTRAFPEIDASSSDVMAMNQDILRQHGASREWAVAMAFGEIRKVTDPLNARQMDLLTKNLILPDIMKDVEEGLYDGKDELPFGYADADELLQDLQMFQAEAAADPVVTEALRRRGQIAQRLTQRLVKNDLLPPGVLEDSRYFHRQVLKYFQAQDFTFTGVGGNDVRLKTKGFQKSRVGGGDFNTAYQEAELEWMAQGWELLSRLGTLDRLQQLNDIKGQLKQEAKARNEAAYYEKLQDELGFMPDPDPLLKFRSRIAYSNAGLAKLAEEGELYTKGGQFDDLIEQLAEGYTSWKAEMSEREPDQRTPFRFQHSQWFNFLSHVLDEQLPGAMQAATIFKAIREREATIRAELGPRYIDPRNAKELARRLAPEGYEVWQPDKGNHFFRALTVEERVLEAALEEGRPLEREEVRQQLVMGGPKEQWIIPGELARTLNQVAPIPDYDPVDALWRAGQASWKQWILLNPVRFLRYNLNNMSGDADIAFAYDPKIITKYGKKAAQDLARHFRGKAGQELEVEMLEAIRLGVVGSGLRVAEIPDINETGAFQHLTSGRLNPGQKIVQKYWTSVRGFTDWRENVLRLAAWRYFQDRMAAGDQGLYAASTKAEVDAIKDPKHRSAKLARELIGDYGNISRGGVWLRRHLIPFYSWIEINAPRYYRLLKNLKHEGQTPGRGRRVAVSGAARLGAKGGALVLKMNVLFLMANLWNHLFFPEEEEELGTNRRQLHLILGRRDDGTIISLRLEGAFSDALEWFNLQDYPSDIAALLEDRKDLLDQGAEFVKAPVERIVNAWEPFAKTTFELVMRRSTYPTIFEEGSSFEARTRPIRDRGEHLTRVFSLNRLYSRITGKPRRESRGPLGDILGTTLLYSTDPGEAAYWQAKDMAADWLEETGQQRPDISPTKRSTALYYWKKAVQWGDEKAEEKWWNEYMELGGSVRGARQSIRMGAPLGSIAQRDQKAFLATLTEREREVLGLAQEWYNSNF